jgi:hemoglobin
MTHDATVRANARRAEIQAHAGAMGIDEAYVSRLVDAFYERVRADARLGPIFDAVIGDRWDEHLPRMKRFWASVALNAGTYSGKPVPAHQQLKDVEPQDFQVWLALFRRTLEDTAPSQKAVSYFMERAERIAESLQLAMFGFPGLPRKRP